jgi:hypothetical protein
MLFFSDAEHEPLRDEIDHTLRRELPHQVCGYPTNFGHNEDDTTVMAEATDDLVNHQVTITTTRSYFIQYLNYDPEQPLRVIDWLTFPEQRLRSIVSGRVFHDGTEQLEPIQNKLRYYPHDVWLYLLAAQWRRIAQEEPFMGRCGQVGDELGSRLVASRLVRDLMRLCFLMEKKYAPYIKWLGTAFAQLDCSDKLMPILTRALEAPNWQERESYFTLAYEFVAAMHNELGVTDPLPTQVSSFHNRPFLVIHGDRFADAIRAAITSQEVRDLPLNLGGADQFVDSTDVLDDPERFDRLKMMYEREPVP